MYLLQPPLFSFEQMYLSGELSTKEILVDTEELAISSPKGEKRLGKGEAAAIALAKTYDGILASNNLKDVAKYVERYKLEHVTTGDILVAALKVGHINEATGNQIWRNMIARRRMLPTNSFTDYLKTLKIAFCNIKVIQGCLERTHANGHSWITFS